MVTTGTTAPTTTPVEATESSNPAVDTLRSVLSPSRTNVAPSERPISLIGGAALVLFGLWRRSPLSFLLALGGAEMLYRGATGYCPVYGALGVNTAEPTNTGQAAGLAGQAATRGIHVEKTITVNRPREEVYCAWRDFENFPRFMKHLEAVACGPNGMSHWVAKAPLGAKVEWDAEVINDLQNEMIAWRSIGDSAVPNSGFVRFADAPEGRGTEVKVLLEYNPPAGIIGATFARLFGEEPEKQLDDDLRRFKQMMEAGEIPMTEGQPTGRGRKIGDEFYEGRHEELDKIRASDAEEQVGAASEESFPASDPPGWTGRREDNPSA